MNIIRKISGSGVFTLLALFDLAREERRIAKFASSMQHEEKAAKATEIIRNHMGFAAGAALVPFPGADLAAVSAVQVNMMRQLAKLYQVPFMDDLGKSIIAAIAGGSVARIGASLVKAIPGVGTAIGSVSMPVLSAASTWALGRVVANHLHQGGSLASLDLGMAQKRYRQEMEEGKALAEQMARESAAQQAIPAEDPIEKVKRLSELHQAGILTDEEFAAMKRKLLMDH